MAPSGSPYIYSENRNFNYIVPTVVDTIKNNPDSISDPYNYPSSFSNMNENTVGGMVNVNPWTPDLLAHSYNIATNNHSSNLNNLSNVNNLGSNTNSVQGGNVNSYGLPYNGQVMNANSINQYNVLQQQAHLQNQGPSQTGGMNLHSNINGQFSGSAQFNQNMHTNLQYLSMEQQEMELKAAAQKQREQQQREQQQKNAQKAQLAAQVAQMSRNGVNPLSGVSGSGLSSSNGFPLPSPQCTPVNIQQPRLAPNGNDGHAEKQPCQYGATCKYFTNEFTDKEKTEHHMKHYTHHANPCKFGATCKFYTGEFTDMEKYRPHMALFTHPPRNANAGNGSNKAKGNLHRNHVVNHLGGNHTQASNMGVPNGNKIGGLNSLSSQQLYNLQQQIPGLNTHPQQQQPQQQQQGIPSSNSTPLMASNSNQQNMKSYRNIVLNNNDISQGQEQQRQLQGNISAQNQNITSAGTTNSILSGNSSSASLSSLMYPNSLGMQPNNGSGSLSGGYSDDNSSVLSQQKNLYQLHFLNENNNQTALTNDENINMYNNINRSNQDNRNLNGSSNNTVNSLFPFNQTGQLEGDNQYLHFGSHMQPNVDSQYQQKSYYQQNFAYNDQMYGQNMGMFNHVNSQKDRRENSSYSNDVDSSGVSVNDEGKSILSNTDNNNNNVHGHGTSSNSSSSGVSSNAPSTTSSRSGSGGIVTNPSLLKMQDNEYLEQNGDDLSNSSSSYEEGSNPIRNNERRSQDDLESNSLNNSKSSVSHSGGDNSSHLNFFPLLSKSPFASPSSVIDGVNYTTSTVGPLGNSVDVDGATKQLYNFTINTNKNNLSNENSPNSFRPSHSVNQKSDNNNVNNRFVNENGNASNENEDRVDVVDLSFLESALGNIGYNGMNSNQNNSPL